MSIFFHSDGKQLRFTEARYIQNNRKMVVRFAKNFIKPNSIFNIKGSKHTIQFKRGIELRFGHRTHESEYLLQPSKILVCCYGFDKL